MSFEKLVGSALRDGARISLRKVMQSDSLADKVTRNLGLAERFSPRTHRGIALRVGPQLFGTEMNFEGEKAALKTLREYAGDMPPKREILLEGALIEELGERLINAACKWQRANFREMARAFREAESADQQVGLLGGLGYLVRYSNPRDDEPVTGLPAGYEWLDGYFNKMPPDRYLPALLRRSKKPNCLGMAVALSGWAQLSGARFLFCTEIIDQNEEYHRFRLETQRRALQLLNGRKGRDAQRYRQMLKGDHRRLTGWQSFLRDWHHAIAIELKDGRWFYLDPFGEQEAVFPEEWGVSAIARTLHKYSEVAPGMALLGTDKGAQQQSLNASLERFYSIVDKIELVRYKLAKGLGSDYSLEHIMEVAPELEYFCDLFMDNHLTVPRPAAPPARRLFWLMFGWGVNENYLWKLRSQEEVNSQQKRFRSEPAFRQLKFDDLVVRLCHEALQACKPRGSQINPALEFGNPAHTVGMVVLSNLASWTEDQEAAKLLLEHSNSQMIWHEAVSPIPDFETLGPRAKAYIRHGQALFEGLPQHELVRLKRAALKEIEEFS